MTESEAKAQIIELIEKAQKVIPEKYENNLLPTKLMPHIPDWHNYEHIVWNLGEKIRQILNEYKELLDDKDLHTLLLNITLNKNAKRGRQPFIMLFGYVKLTGYAGLLIQQIDDDFVQLHIIDTVYKMRAEGFSNIISNYINSKNTQVRNISKKYLKKFS